jgi:predicted transposase YbfD/YdcC
VTRELQASRRLAGHAQWPGLAQVLRLTRTTVRAGKQTVEIAYAITSLSPERANAARLLALWRDHWRIENSLHWVRDVAFGEDACRAKTGYLPQNLAACRNTALTVIRLRGWKGITATLRHFSTRTDQLLETLGSVKY